MKDILASIVKYRQDRGWSEYQLAEEAGLPQSTISSWYRKNMTPSIQSLEKVCSAFGISLSQLFAREGEAMDLTQEQRYLLERWAGLSPEQREALMKLIETMWNPRSDEGLTLLCSGKIKYSFSVGSIPGRGSVENVLNVTDLASDERELTDIYYLCFVKSDHVAKNYADENGCRTLELTDGTVVRYANREYINLVNDTWKYLQVDYNDYIY